MSLVIDELGPAALEIGLHGRLNKTDYEELIPAVEGRLARHDRLSVLVDVRDFDGWTPSGLWEDVKFDVKHYHDFERMALLGKDASRKWMATLSRPFTGARVEFFHEGEIDRARAWVRGGEPS